jgi:hypothetical protein
MYAIIGQHLLSLEDELVNLDGAQNRRWTVDLNDVVLYRGFSLLDAEGMYDLVRQALEAADHA